MPLFPKRRAPWAIDSPAAEARPSAAFKLSQGAIDSVTGGNDLMPFIATPPGQGRAAREAYAQAQSASYAFIYRTQPAVRKVVDYIARNAAQVGLRLYQRVDVTDRKEDYDHPAAASLRRPNAATPGRRFLESLVSDHLIYRNAYAIKFRPDSSDRLVFLRVPVWAIQPIVPSSFIPEAYRVSFRDGAIRDFDPSDVVHLSGYDPNDPAAGLSPLETLRLILAEEATNQAANVERLKHGGLGPGYIKRPIEAPEWSGPARERFETDWKDRAKGKRDGERVDPVLEEGMEFVESSISPRDQEMLSSRRFTRQEVASLYGLPADLIDALEKPGDRAEARTQFYADCLPPLLNPIAEELDLQVLEDEYGAVDHYFEWNLAEKLRGQVEERFKVLVGAAGAPILTRNEARRRENLPEVEGGDELITPLNVVVGSKPSTNVNPPQDPNGPPDDGSHRDDTAAETPLERPSTAILLERRKAQADRRDRYAAEHTELLRKTFSRQAKSYRSSKTFDQARWDAELADDLEAKALSTVEREGGIAAERLLLAGGFDLDRTRNYLRKGAEERAQAINNATANAIERFEKDDQARAADPEDEKKRDPFDEAQGDRAEQGGLAIATSLTSFAHHEAAQQTPDAAQRVKTWVVTAANSRHPDLDGETAPLYGTFSNGAQFPGDPHLDAKETARCQCLLEVA